MAAPWEKYAAPEEEGPWKKRAAEKPELAPGSTDVFGPSGRPTDEPLTDDYSGRWETPAAAVVEPLLAMATGAVAKPVSEVMGLAALLREATPWGVGGDPRAFQQDVQQALTYEPRTAVGRSEANPLNAVPQLIGKGVHAIAGGTGDLISRAVPESLPNIREGVKNLLTEGIQQGVGFAGAKGVPAAGAAAKPVLQTEARSMVRRALKPSVAAERSGDAAKAIQTMLDEGLNVSSGGLETLRSRVNALNDQIKEAIADSTATIDKAAVASRLDRLINDFAKQVKPGADLKTVRAAWNEFMSHPLLSGSQSPLRAHLDRPGIETTIRKAAVDELGPSIVSTLEQVAGEQPGRATAPRSIGVPPPAPTIPVQLAQEMKQGTYRALGNKAYGELKGADIEAQKALARGLKEEIATAVPEVAPLNAAESKLLNLEDLLEHRVAVEGRKNPLGLGWLNPKTIVPWALDRSSIVKSMLARLLNATGEKLGRSTGKIAGPAGIVIANQSAADEERERKRRLAEMLKGR